MVDTKQLVRTAQMLKAEAERLATLAETIDSAETVDTRPGPSMWGPGATLVINVADPTHALPASVPLTRHQLFDRVEAHYAVMGMEPPREVIQVIYDAWDHEPREEMGR